MMFLDVIATPFYMLFGFGFLFILLGVACVVTITMIIFALFQRFGKKNKNTEDETAQK